MSSNNFTFRLPDDIRQKLEERAEKEGRTLSSLVIYILRETVKNESDK